MFTVINIIKVLVSSFILKVIFTAAPAVVNSCFYFHSYTIGGIVSPGCNITINYCPSEKIYEIHNILKNNDTFTARSDKLSSFSDIVLYNTMSCDCTEISHEKTLCASTYNTTHGIARFKYLNFYYKTFIELKDWESQTIATKDIMTIFDKMFKDLYD